MSDDRNISGGYEDPTEGDDLTPTEWLAEPGTNFFSHTSHLVVVKRDGEPVGMIRAGSSGEQEWLCRRLTGSFDPETSID